MVNPGLYNVNVITAAPSHWVRKGRWISKKHFAGAHVAVSCAGKRLRAKLADDSRGKPSLDWYLTSAVNTVGTVDINRAGEQRLVLEATKLPEWGVMLHSVELVKADG